MNHIEDISNYFATDAPERNAQAFEERIKTDTVFAQDVANYLAQQNTIRQSQRNRVTDADRQALQQRLQEFKQTEKPSFFVVYKKQFSMAAAILLFVTGLYWINNLNGVETKSGTLMGGDTTQNARIILPDSIKIDTLKHK